MPSMDFIRETMRRLSEKEKRDYLQRIIGPPTDDSLELDWRARLMTVLSEAKVWPHDSSQEAWRK
jgi:hypothetical protein